MDIVLASASPRRRKLLKMLYDDFRVVPSDIREYVPRELEVEKCPEYLARAKVKEISSQYSKSFIIGCDTSVIIDGKILNKPRDTNDARKMITMLSGRVHKVITGCCLYYRDEIKSFSVVTEVEFFELSNDEIENYIHTSEPYDKAGGYGIQSMGALFVKSIDGDYYNIVGLPVSRLKREIEAFVSELENKKQ